MMGSLLFAVSAAVLIGPPSQAAAGDVTIARGLVSLIEEAHVPSKEAGVLMEIVAKEGTHVASDDVLVKLDDHDAQAAANVAKYKYEVADEEAKSDVGVRYATTGYEVAKADYNSAIEANKRLPNTVQEAEVRKLYAMGQRSVMEIEKAKMDQRIAVLQAKVAEAEMEVADENLRRRHVLSPIDGVVIEVGRHKGEWVQPGDAVVHVVRLDRLRVEGFVKASEVAPSAVAGKPVSVSVDLANGRRENFNGQIVFVKPEVQSGGDYRVWAEIENRQEDGQWLVWPGLYAEIVIHTK